MPKIVLDDDLAFDPPVSEKQRRAMEAAAHGHSTLGIPESVGKEFVGDTEFNEADHPRGEGGKFSTVAIGSLKKTGGQLGSNPGGVYSSETGEKYYIKQGHSRQHAVNEYTAGKLYNLAGAKTLDYVQTDDPHKIATKWAEKQKDSAKKFDAQEKKAAQLDFAVHAWLANWDAAGLDYDNLAIIDNRPASVDLGGALNYRAQGAPKGSAFGETVGEWDTLRDPNINPQNAKIFGKMTNSDLVLSAAKVLAVSDDAIREAAGDDKLADKLIARKRDIAQRVKTLAADGLVEMPDGVHIIRQKTGRDEEPDEEDKTPPEQFFLEKDGAQLILRPEDYPPGLFDTDEFDEEDDAESEAPEVKETVHIYEEP